jgi:hypothetical protein
MSASSISCAGFSGITNSPFPNFKIKLYPESGKNASPDNNVKMGKILNKTRLI